MEPADAVDRPRSDADAELPDDNTAHDDGAADVDQRLVGALERAGHAARTLLSRQAYLAGASPLQFQLLTRLGSTTVRHRVSDLAVELDVSQATVSEALSAMGRKGWVTKERDPADRRTSAFGLSAEGEALSTQIGQWDRPLLDSLARLDARDKGTALRVALTLIADVQASGAINVARTCLTCRYFDDVTHPDADAPYHCLLLDVPFGDTELRVDCQEHERRTPGTAGA